MQEVARAVIEAKHVRSLAWDGDELVDWVGGGARLRLDGTTERAKLGLMYRFDRAIVGPKGWAIVFEGLGTKALLLRHGKVVRELDRSFYFAHCTTFPITFAQITNRLAVIWARDAYNRLAIADAETGADLSVRATKSPDFFQSRLSVSPDGRWLLSAGWVWHPFEVIQLSDLHHVAREPAQLDAADLEIALPAVDVFNVDDTNAAFDAQNRVVLSLSFDSEPPSEFASMLGVYEPSTSTMLSFAGSSAVPGTLMPVGSDEVVIFSDHPRLVRLRDGAILHTWDDLVTDEPRGCITTANARPPIALDSAHCRFAVASAESVTVVQLGES